jgi:copper chaperone NosL
MRALIALAALLPALSYFFPLWHYYFEAPQYPEGLSMSIWSFQLAGRVDLINGLNHYVGFMQLDAADFFEFRVLPVLIGVVVVGGLWVAISGARRALNIWIAGFALFGVAAFLDFYRWLYAFGHTIDPKAIIDIEGYTPPMFGSSVFMNFFVLSYPGVGFYALAAGLLLGIVAWALVWRRGRRSRRRNTPSPPAVA